MIDAFGIDRPDLDEISKAMPSAGLPKAAFKVGQFARKAKGLAVAHPVATAGTAAGLGAGAGALGGYKVRKADRTRDIGQATLGAGAAGLAGGTGLAAHGALKEFRANVPKTVGSGQVRAMRAAKAKNLASAARFSRAGEAGLVGGGVLAGTGAGLKAYSNRKNRT